MPEGTHLGPTSPFRTNVVARLVFVVFITINNYQEMLNVKVISQVLGSTQHTWACAVRSWVEKENVDLGFCFYWGGE